MADTKISALTAVGTPAGAQEVPVNDAGTTKKLTLTQINAYTEPVSASSVAAQSAVFASDTIVSGSVVTIAPARLQAGSFYRCRFSVTKSAAGVAVATATLRMGTLGTTGDAAICTFTFPSAQTAAVDNMFVECLANFRSVGAGTAAVVAGELILLRSNTTTGFLSTAATTLTIIRVTSSGFNSTTPTKISLSMNGGASAAWTTTVAQADTLNIT